MTKTKSSLFGGGLLAALLLAGCGATTPAANALAPGDALPAAATAATVTPALQPSLSAASEAPTFTSTSAPTAELTATPTATRLPLPVSAGTPIPYPLEPIRPETAAGVVRLSRIGYGTGYVRGMYGLTLSADEKRLIVSTTAGFGVFSADDLSLQHFLVDPSAGYGQGGKLQVVSHDGAVAVTTDGVTVRVWDLATGENLSEQPFPESDTYEGMSLLAISIDDSLLAIAYDSGAIQIFSLPDAKPVKRITRYVGFVREPMSLAFEPSGKRLYLLFHDIDIGVQSVGLAIGSWEQASAKVVDATKFSYTYAVLAPTRSQGGGYRYGYFSYGLEPRLTVYDYEKLGPRFTIPLSAPVSTIGLSSNSQWIALGNAASDQVEVWEEEKIQGPVLTFPGHDNMIWGTAVTQDGQTVYSIGWDGLLRKWKAGEQAAERQVNGFYPLVSDIAFTPGSGNLLLSSDTGSLFEIDPKTGDLVRTLADSREPRRSAWQKALVSSETFLDVFGEQISALNAGWSPCPISVSGDGGVIAQGCNRVRIPARLWNAASGEVQNTFEDPALPIANDRGTNAKMALSPDGQFLAVTYSSIRDDFAIRIYDAASHRLLRTLAAKRQVLAMSFSPDGTRLVTVGNMQAVRVLDPTNGQVVKEIRIPADSGEGASELAFSADGALLFVQASNTNIYVFSTADWTETKVLKKPVDVLTFAVSPKSTLLALGTGKNRVYLWDYQNDTLYPPLELSDIDPIRDLEFSPDGRLLAVLTRDSVVHLLGVQP